MRIELENALAGKFPFMRVERFWAEGEPRWFPVYTDCGDGWYPLIRNMCREIRDLYASQGIAPDLRVTKIQSGYRGMRYTVYFTPVVLEGGAPSCRRQAMNILERYARMAAGVCEHCGRPGEPREREIYECVLCDNCLEKKVKQLEKKYPFMRADPEEGAYRSIRRVFISCRSGWRDLIRESCQEVADLYAAEGLETDFWITYVSPKRSVKSFQSRGPPAGIIMPNLLPPLPPCRHLSRLL